MRKMTAMINIGNLAHWEQCPVFLPFSQHTIAPIVPAYLGILLPFIIFDIVFFMYVHSLLMDNADSDYDIRNSLEDVYKESDAMLLSDPSTNSKNYSKYKGNVFSTQSQI